jgi:hypothetical protein
VYPKEVDAHLLHLTLTASRQLLGDKASVYEPILSRIQVAQDGGLREDPSRIAFDLGVLQADQHNYLDDTLIKVTNLLMAVISILSLERRFNGNVPSKESSPFVETLRQVCPTRMELIGG